MEGELSRQKPCTAGRARWRGSRAKGPPQSDLPGGARSTNDGHRVAPTPGPQPSQVLGGERGQEPRLVEMPEEAFPSWGKLNGCMPARAIEHPGEVASPRCKIMRGLSSQRRASCMHGRARDLARTGRKASVETVGVGVGSSAPGGTRGANQVTAVASRKHLMCRWWVQSRRPAPAATCPARSRSRACTRAKEKAPEVPFKRTPACLAMRCRIPRSRASLRERSLNAV
jgi:hypothetical protein